MPVSPTHIPGLLLAGALAAAAAAHQPQPTPGARPNAPGSGAIATGAIPGSRPLTGADLQRVTMGAGDISVLGADGRLPLANLRVFNDFTGLYRIPTTARTKYAGWYAREHGGVMAVFPQSVYSRDGDGNIIVDVPPGTIYLVGGIPQDDSHRAATIRPENKLLSHREDTSINAPNTNARPTDLPASSRMFAMTPTQLVAVQQGTIDALVNDEAFAAKRITLRLQQALAAKPALTKPSESPAAATPVPAPPSPVPPVPAVKPAPATPSTPPVASGWKRTPSPEKPEAATVPAPSPQPAKPESK